MFVENIFVHFFFSFHVLICRIFSLFITYETIKNNLSIFKIFLHFSFDSVKDTNVLYIQSEPEFFILYRRYFQRFQISSHMLIQQKYSAYIFCLLSCIYCCLTFQNYVSGIHRWISVLF